MKELTRQELSKVEGGGAGTAFALGCLFAGIIIFAIGVMDGYMRPLKCNS